MYLNSDEVVHRIEQLKLPSIFVEIARARVHKALRGAISSVDRFYKCAAKLTGRVPEIGGFLPLWEVNGDAVVALDEKRDGYFRYHYGDLTSEKIGNTYQQLITSLFLDLADSGVVNELNELSESFGYHYLQELLVFIRTPAAPGSWAVERRAFIESVQH